MDTTIVKQLNKNEHDELVTKANEIINAIKSTSRKSQDLLRMSGSKFYKTESYPWQFEIYGHRGMIGFLYWTIREECRISIEDIADKCDVTTEKMEELEASGFMSISTNGLCYEEYEKLLIKNIYVGYLKLILHENYLESFNLNFDDMDMIITYLSVGIMEELNFIKTSEPKVISQSFKYLLDEYKRIQEILGPYLCI